MWAIYNVVRTIPIMLLALILLMLGHYWACCSGRCSSFPMFSLVRAKNRGRGPLPAAVVGDSLLNSHSWIPARNPTSYPVLPPPLSFTELKKNISFKLMAEELHRSTWINR